MTITTRTYIDWDYTPGATIDYTTAGDEITAYVMKTSIRLGGQAYERVASVGTCNLTVRNTTRAFSPGYSGATYYGKLLPLKPVKVTATDGVTTWTVFVGWTKSFTPQSDRYGERKAFIACVDWLGVIQMSNIEIPLRENVRSDQLVLDVLNYAVKAPTATGRFDFVGQPLDGNSFTVNGTVYVAKNTMIAANQIQIGASAATGMYDTIKALIAAINGWDDSGLYYANTTRPSFVRARESDSYYAIVKQDAPVRWYRLGEGAGTTAYDLGSNGSNGTINGTPALGTTGAIANDVDKCITFDGVNDYVAVPTLELANCSFTVEFWFKAAASPPANQDLFSAHVAFAANQAFYIRYTNTGAISANFYSGTSISGIASLATGSWHHIVFVYDYAKTRGYMYVNGIEQSNAAAGPFTGLTPTIQIGAYTAAGASYAKADIDECAIWLRVLSASEVYEHYVAKTSAPAPGVTLFSTLPGAIGNGFALSETAANVTVTGATLSGGVDAPNVVTSIQQGYRTFGYAGDSWDNGYNALSALTDVTESERGRLFVKRNGTFTWQNFAQELNTYTATPVLQTAGNSSGDTDPIVLLDGGLSDDDIINSIEVRFTPRATTATGVVAKITTPFKVQGRWGQQNSDPNFTKPAYTNAGYPIGDPGHTVVTLPYTDPDTGQRIGAKDLVLPLVAATDWTANEARDGSMVEYTTITPQYLFFSVAEKGSKCDISVKNTAGGALYIRTLQVRGTKITRYDQQTVVKEDATSIALYGRRQKTITIPLETLDSLGTSVAEYELSRYLTLAYRVRSVDWRNLTVDQVGNKVLAADIGDVMSLHETQAMDYSSAKLLTIVGITYEFGLRNDYNVTFDVEAADYRNFGIYDRAQTLYDSSCFTI